MFSSIIGLITGRATGEAYMRSEPRATLTKAANSALMHINPAAVLDNDAGNWTGCQPFVGNKVGTHRDLSACWASSILGRPITSEELGEYSENDVKKLFIDEFNNLGLNQLSDQEVANIVMHIKLHFGNVRVVQRALNDLGENLSTDGGLGPATLSALKRQTNKNPAATYNAIRTRLEEAYQGGPAGFFTLGLANFPPRSNMQNLSWVIAIILLIIILIVLTILFL